jgi:integrase
VQNPITATPRRLTLRSVSLCYEAFIRNKHPTYVVRLKLSFEEFRCWFQKETIVDALFELFSSGIAKAHEIAGDWRQFSAHCSWTKINARLNCLRAFSRALDREGVIDWRLATPTNSMKPQVSAALDARHGQCAPLESIVKIRKSLAKDRRVIGARDRAIFALLSEVMLAAPEVHRLTLGDIDLANGRIRVKRRVGVRGAYHELPLSPPVITDLSNWMRHNPGGPNDPMFIWIDQDGWCAPNRPSLRVATMAEIIRSRCAKARVAPVKPHHLRNAGVRLAAQTCAREMIPKAAGMALTRVINGKIFNDHFHLVPKSAQQRLARLLSQQIRR